MIELGEASYDVIVTDDGNWAVCGGYNNNKVKIIDLNTYQVVAELATGQRPMELTYAPTINRVFSGNIKSNSISVIELDGAGSSVIKTVSCGVIGVYIPFFGIRSGVEISPDEKYLLIAASFDDKLKIMETETNQIVADLSVGDFPLSIAFNATGDRVCVTNLFDHSYSIIQLEGATSSVITTLPANGDYPVNVNYNASDDLFYICNYYSENLVKVDPESGIIQENINYSAYGGVFQVEMWNSEPVYLTVGNSQNDAGVLFRDTLFILPANPSYLDLAEVYGEVYAGVSIPGPDYLSIINLDLNTKIDLPVHGETSSWNIYPNPSTGTINISSAIPLYKIEVYNMSGKCIQDIIINAEYNNAVLSIPEKGIHIVEITFKNLKRFSKKVIIN